MKLGSLDLGKKLFLAPMADISDAPFRKLAKEFGAGLTFTQMVSAKGVINNDFDSLRLLAFPRSEKPIGVQLLGNDPDLIKNAVKEITRYQADVIDLNCGCPVSKVTKHKMGASLLNDPRHLGKIVKAMVEGANGVPISIKIRLGRDRKNINVLENAKAAEDNGASMVIIHARTRVDRYFDNPQWEWIARVKEKMSIPVVGNGSLFEPQDVKRMIKETGCDSAMIARGALGNPFIFQRFNSLIETGVDPGPPTLEMIEKIAIMHAQMLIKEYGDIVAVNKAKKHIIWYFRNYDGMNNILEKIFSFNDISELIEYISEHVQKIKEGFYPSIDRAYIDQLFNEKVQFWYNEEIKI